MTAIRLHTHRVEKPWGRRELWPGFDDVADGGEPVGEIWFQLPGGEDAELLIKYLFTSEKLSIQVHPDDAQAQARGHKRGKDEAWVILAADPIATIAIGTLSPMTGEEFRASAEDGTIEGKVDWRAVRDGDVYFSPSGTVHAIGPGLTLVEVQQNSDVTYRLWDYGRPRELHLDDGVAVSKPMPYVAPFLPIEAEKGRTILVDGPTFVLERWVRSGAGTLTCPGADRPVWLVPLAGEGTLDGETFTPGGAWMVEGEGRLELGPDTDLLVAYPKAGVAEGLWG